MAKTKIQSMADFFSSMDRETLTQKDFLAAFKRVTELIKRIKQGQDDSNTNLDGRLNEFSQGQIQKLETAIAELRIQVNDVFIGERFTGLVKEKLEEITQRTSELRDGKDADSAEIIKLLKGDLDFLSSTKGEQGSPDSEHDITDKLNLLEDAIEPRVIKGLLKDFEEFKAQLKRIAEARVMGGPNANAVRVHIVSGQCDGENRRFTMPMARQILKFEMSQFPFNLYQDSSSETHGFTVGDRFLDLNSAVSPPERGQSASIYYIK